jgi:hypothetical protein
MFDQYEDDDMLMVMSLAEYWEIINRLKMLDDRMIGMRRLMGSLVNQGFFLDDEE